MIFNLTNKLSDLKHYNQYHSLTQTWKLMLKFVQQFLRKQAIDLTLNKMNNVLNAMEVIKTTNDESLQIPKIDNTMNNKT